MIFLLRLRLSFWELFTYGRFRRWASLALDRALVSWEDAT
jgi:hypothetical protein